MAKLFITDVRVGNAIINKVLGSEEKGKLYMNSHYKYIDGEAGIHLPYRTEIKRGVFVYPQYVDGCFCPYLVAEITGIDVVKNTYGCYQFSYYGIEKTYSGWHYNEQTALKKFLKDINFSFNRETKIKYDKDLID